MEMRKPPFLPSGRSDHQEAAVSAQRQMTEDTRATFSKSFLLQVWGATTWGSSPGVPILFLSRQPPINNN